MKKVFAILVALMLVLSMSTVAMAANDGSITIENTAKDITYTIYKVFDATYSGTNVSYTWSGTLKDVMNDAECPFEFTLNSEGSYNVTKKQDATDQAIIKWVKDNAAEIGTAAQTVTGDGSAKVVTGLAYGYYYITTSTGSAVTIDSALKDVIVVDKNEDGPSVPDKKVDDQDSNVASIGDTVNFKVIGTIARYDGETKIEKYTFTDTMSTGLTYNKDIVVKVGEATLTKDTDYTVTETENGYTLVLKNIDDEGSFKYAVDAAYEITYSATVNENAVVAGNGNSNTVQLEWNNKSETDTTQTYTYQFKLIKTDGTNTLKGAKFKLYNVENAGNEIPLVRTTTGYRPATKAEKEVDGFVSAEIEVGEAIIYGLGNGTYYLEETEAPAGYNKLTARVAVTINNANAVDQTVVNNAGTELPSTGGIGTTIFYVVGGLLMAAAVVLLVTKKKVNASK